MKNDPTFKFVALASVAALALAFVNPTHSNAHPISPPATTAAR